MARQYATLCDAMLVHFTKQQSAHLDAQHLIRTAMLVGIIAESLRKDGLDVLRIADQQLRLQIGMSVPNSMAN